MIPKFASCLDFAQLSLSEAIAGQAAYLETGGKEDRLASVGGGHGARLYHR